MDAKRVQNKGTKRCLKGQLTHQHLLRKDNTFYFRQVIPAELCGRPSASAKPSTHFFKGERPQLGAKECRQHSFGLRGGRASFRNQYPTKMVG